MSQFSHEDVPHLPYGINLTPHVEMLETKYGPGHKNEGFET